MAKQTRQERRARRTQQQPALAGGPPSRPSTRPTERGEPEPRRPRQATEEHKGFAPVRFVQESIGELKKVEWPNQSQVLQGTAVVLIACLIVGVYLYANDLIWKRVVQNVFLGQ